MSRLSCLGQLSCKFITVFILLTYTVTVHRRHPHSKVREYFIGFALHPEEEEEEEEEKKYSRPILSGSVRLYIGICRSILSF